MRAALIASLLLAAPAARGGTPLSLAERQVVFLDFDRAVARIAVTDPDLISLQALGTRLRVTALRGGRASLEVAFEDGASAVYDVTVEPVRRPSLPPPSVISLLVGEERKLRAPGAKRVLLEENGVARVRIEGELVSVIGLSTGSASLVVVDGAGARTTWTVQVR